jgi:hypothetical protein
MKRNFAGSADGTLDQGSPADIQTTSMVTAALRTGIETSSAAVSRLLSAAALVAVVATPSLGVAQEAHEGKSAEEIAKELANPNNSLASLTFKNQFRWYKGDLPGADDQSNYTLLFQPVFPFPLAPTASGGKPNVFVRPAIPLLVDQPVPKPAGGTLDWDGTTAIGDIGFDLAYGVTEKNGLLWAVGMVGTLPTATDSDVAGKQWRLGPELLFAKMEKWGLYGLFPSHQWDVAGWGEGKDKAYSTSQLQAFLKFLPGGGWSVGSLPIMNYDWKAEEWTVPLNLDVSKTVKWGNTPVKLEVELNYYVEQPDPFGPEWMVGFNVTPVVPNFINNWIRGK